MCSGECICYMVLAIDFLFGLFSSPFSFVKLLVVLHCLVVLYTVTIISNIPAFQEKQFFAYAGKLMLSSCEALHPHSSSVTLALVVCPTSTSSLCTCDMIGEAPAVYGNQCFKHYEALAICYYDSRMQEGV